MACFTVSVWRVMLVRVSAIFLARAVWLASVCSTRAYRSSNSLLKDCPEEMMDFMVLLIRSRSVITMPTSGTLVSPFPAPP